jgi:hypothetical protein
MVTPFYLAIDGNDHLWVANSGNSTISEFDTSGNDLFDSGPEAGGLSAPEGIAVDGAEDVWVANYGSGEDGMSLTEFPFLAGVAQMPLNITGGDLDGPYAIAIDGAGNAWATNLGALNSNFDYTGDSITEVPIGKPAVNITGGGLNGPYAIAIDGAGNAWVANYGTPPYSLSEVSIIGTVPTAVSPTGTGYTGEVAASPFGPVLTNPLGIAIDGSGNVWVVNLTNGTTTPDNVVEFVGAAVPVVTPLAAGVKNGTLGTTP